MGVYQWPRGEIFLVGHSDASGNSQRFRNLDIVVFRSCSIPLAFHLHSREHPQSATPSGSQGAVELRVVRQDASETLRRYSLLGQIAIEDIQ
jgi:hypothetical protein